ncbi:MAG: hypothetical protein RIQ81_635 [Pseudomonadota bacterium]|jgi:DnaJ-class molecular chaperone
MEHEISGLHTGIPSTVPGNHYQTLNIPFGASKTVVREAYLRLKNTLSGDNNAFYSLMGAEDMRAQMEQIEVAFRILNDETTRADYDRQLTRRAGANEAHGTDDGAGWDQRPVAPVHTGAQVITTSRSTLPVIKTVCEGSKSEAFQTQVQSMVSDSDLGDGELFRRIRESLGVTENEMQERTKISLEYLRSMEANRFDRLPQVVYVKGFLRSYFRYLGVDNFEPMVKAFAARLEAWQSAKKR